MPCLSTKGSEQWLRAPFFVLAALVGAFPSPRDAYAAGPVVQVVQITGHRARFDNPAAAAFVRYLLIDPGNADPLVDGFEPIAPLGVLMLFTGGDGTLNLQATQLNTGSTNFLVRTRYHFASQGFVVAVVDAASDFNAHNHPLVKDTNGFVHGSGLRGHRLPGRLHADKHLRDLAVIMSDLRMRYPNLPLWAVGTSRGTVSAAVTAVAAPPRADGVVFTSSLTGPDASEDMQGIELEAIQGPALIVSHQDDQCPLTRPQDSWALKKRLAGSARVQVLHFNGGSTPLSDPCDPLAPHGYFGIEQNVVEAVTRWIKHSIE